MSDLGFFETYQRIQTLDGINRITPQSLLGNSSTIRASKVSPAIKFGKVTHFYGRDDKEA